MALWISRLRSSARPLYTKFRNSFSREHGAAAVSTAPAAAERFRKPSFSHWDGSFLQLALAVSAGSLALHSHYSTNALSCCEAPNLDQTYVDGFSTQSIDVFFDIFWSIWEFSDYCMFVYWKLSIINGVCLNYLQFSDKRIGGTGSTDYVVKGSHRNVPQELIDELSVICKVLTLQISLCYR